MENKNRISEEKTEDVNKEDNHLTGQEALNKVETNPIQSEDVDGIVSHRSTGSNPEDIAGIQDIDRGISRGSRRNS